MTLQEWITLIIAILGVLHGPATASLFSGRRNSKGVK